MKKRIILSIALGILLNPVAVFADYTITVGSGTADASGYHGWGDSLGIAVNLAEAECFTTIGAGEIASADIWIGRQGTPADSSFGSIYATSAGDPTGTSLGDSGNVNPTDPYTAMQDYTFTWSSPVYVNASTVYCIYLKRTGAGSSVNFYQAADAGLAPDSTAYSRYSNDGVTWTHYSNHDLSHYIVYVTATSTSGGGGASVATSSALVASTTYALLGSIAFGQGIIITLLFIVVVAYVYNRMTPKKKKWQL